MADPPAEAGDAAARGLNARHQMRRRRAQGVRHQPALLMSKRHLQQGHHGCSRPAQKPSLVVGVRPVWHAVSAQQPLYEIRMLPGDLGFELAREGARIRGAIRVVAGRQDDVYAVGPIAYRCIQPGQLPFQLLGAEIGGAQHAATTRLADLGNHVPAVGEGKNRHVDAEQIADRSVHRYGRLQKHVAAVGA
jgi:hypothetical protein